MPLTITLTKKTTYTLITLIILIILGIGVYARAGKIPDPGHSLAELQPCSKGETLVSNSQFWECEKNNWEPCSEGIKYTKGYVGIGQGVGHYNEKIKLSVKGAIQLEVFTSFSTAPPCTSLTRGTIILVTTNGFPRDKMYICLYNIDSYEYMRI